MISFKCLKIYKKEKNYVFIYNMCMLQVVNNFVVQNIPSDDSLVSKTHYSHFCRLSLDTSCFLKS